jgi:hypothetical protein
MMDGELLKKLLDRPIAFHRVFVSVGGGVLPALMLSQAVYWSSRTDDPKGWFYKTQAQWEEETGMGRWEQETARKKLREMGFWYEERRGVPAKLFYRVDMDSLYRSMAAIKNDGIPHTGLRESHNQEGGIPADKSDGIPQSLNTETTTEITTETTTERGNTPPPTETAAAVVAEEEPAWKSNGILPHPGIAEPWYKTKARAYKLCQEFEPKIHGELYMALQKATGKEALIATTGELSDNAAAEVQRATVALYGMGYQTVEQLRELYRTYLVKSKSKTKLPKPEWLTEFASRQAQEKSNGNGHGGSAGEATGGSGAGNGGSTLVVLDPDIQARFQRRREQRAAAAAG